MPELPDLLYIQRYLQREVSGRTITDITVRQSVVLRVVSDQPFQQLVCGKTIGAIHRHGPFLRFALNPDTDMVINLMVAGTLQHQKKGEKARGHLCFSLDLDDQTRLNLCDDELMAKVYIVPETEFDAIPKYLQQGVDVLSDEFTLELFTGLAKKAGRRQVRVFLRDQTLLSSIGNAYADEILFEAGIHPKTFVGKLDPKLLGALYRAIPSVLVWGTREVEKAAQPVYMKVRNHLKVRNRKGELCVRCGSTIRREGVRGHDTYFCPVCQPATRKHFLDWAKIS